MKNRIFVQVRDIIFAFLEVGPSLWKLTDLNEGITKEDLANPLTERNCPSITAFNELFLFVSGGDGLNSVEYYEIATNQWIAAPEMNTVRL